ncbi:hypothetical protein GCM10027456_27060 [Kineosporia babensis]
MSPTALGADIAVGAAITESARIPEVAVAKDRMRLMDMNSSRVAVESVCCLERPPLAKIPRGSFKSIEIEEDLSFDWLKSSKAHTWVVACDSYSEHVASSPRAPSWLTRASDVCDRL